MTTSTSRRITIDPHHPHCAYPHGSDIGGLDPRHCCYCAALVRQDFAQAGLAIGLMRGESADPLDYRYGGPRCGCKP